MKYTAWLTTQTDMTVNGGHCEVNVTENEPTGGPEPMATTMLPVPAATADCDDEAAQDAAQAELTKAGWEIVGEWEQYDHGYTVAVRRTV